MEFRKKVWLRDKILGRVVIPMVGIITSMDEVPRGIKKGKD